MQLIFQGIIFFAVFGLFWYIAASKNIFGLGRNIKTSKDAVKYTILTSLIATIVYVALTNLL
jgi:hypothetical protein